MFKMITDSETVLRNAREMSCEEYLTYCDSIDEIVGSDLIKLDDFFWPDIIRLTDTSLLGLRIPGAYIEIYNIFAINRIKEIAWGFYSNTQQNENENENENEHTLLTSDKLYSMSCIMDKLLANRNTNTESDN